MNELKKRLAGQIAPIEEIGLANDLLEAQAFAFLAVRTIRGLPISSVNTTGVSKPEKGGQITFP
jgi:anhydro-N-acetylmuramic acid kinase